MDPRSSFDPLVAGFTFSGSLLSFIATTLVLICLLYYREEQQSFRHALIFNLALAEWINTLNNTISGSFYLRDRMLYAGPGCTANGFVGQLSVQAADFSILVIAVVTLLTITQTAYLPAASTTKKAAICLSVWIVPITTTIVATSLGAMGPVSGNWCWIITTRTDLRYALTHGWRIAIIFCTAAIYIFVWWFMHRHFRSAVSTDGSSKDRSTWMSKRKGFKKMKGGAGAVGEQREDIELSTMSKSRISRVGCDDWQLSAPEAAYVGNTTEENGAVEEAGRKERRRQRSDSISSSSDASDHEHYTDEHKQRGVRIHPDEANHAKRVGDLLPAGHRRNQSKFDGGLRTTDTMASEFPTRRQTRNMEREIKRVLLLNAYPIMYVLLWIPGLTNRFLEATGNRNNSRVLAALQASSQFVGLANALTYGFNTALRRKVRRWWRGQKKAMGWGRRKQGGTT